MKLQVFKYKFPFKESFSTAKGSLHYREGIYLQLIKDSITAIGEAAPVPGFSPYSTADITQYLKTKGNEIINFFGRDFSLSEALQFIKQQQLPPSLQFCLYTVTATFLAQRNHSSVHDFLFDDPRHHVQMNGVIGINGNYKLNELYAKNYTTIKIKVGTDWKSLIPLLKDIRSQTANIKIRIDANQSWVFEEAQKNLQKLDSYNIEYCEEPLANPNSKSLKMLQDTTNIPIALDESIDNNFTLLQAIKIAPVIVIKPMVLGILSLNKSSYQKAAKHGTKYVFTTSLESGVGRLMTASLAAGLGSQNTAHGLATGGLLAQDLWNDDAFIDEGNFKLPDADTLAQLMNSDLSNLNIQHICTYDY